MEIKLNKLGTFIVLIGLVSTVRMLSMDIRELNKKVRELEKGNKSMADLHRRYNFNRNVHLDDLDEDDI